MTPEEFRKSALEHRYELLGSLAFFRRKVGQGASAVAYEVTLEAIRQGFVAERKPASGGVFDGWVRDKNPPAWAVKGALFLLLDESGYSPAPNEMASIALTLAELFPDDDESQLLRFFKDSLADKPWPDVLAVACQARKRRIADSK